MNSELLLSFLGASILVTVMPGPDNIFVLTESLTNGRRNGILIATGLSLGVLIHTLAAATGLSLIIQKSAVVFSFIKYLGTAYLLYLSYKAFREKTEGIEIASESTEVKASSFSLVKKGFLMNVLNPKVTLFFIAFLPQFIDKNKSDVTFQMIILGLTFMLQSLVIFVTIAYLSGKLSSYINNLRFRKITKWSKIAVLSGLAMVLAFEKR